MKSTSPAFDSPVRDRQDRLKLAAQDGIIRIDSEPAIALGFTSDRFHLGSYLWKLNNTIIISFIASNARGNFRQLVNTILHHGYAIEIPTPLGRMEQIVAKNGYRHEQRFCDQLGELIDVWRLEPSPCTTCHGFGKELTVYQGAIPCRDCAVR